MWETSLENKICPYEKPYYSFELFLEWNLILMEKDFSGYHVENKLMCVKTGRGRLLKRLFP